MKLYDNLSDTEKYKLIKKEYEENLSSFAEIAKTHGTYPNKIRRDAIKLKIKIRDKSEAQKTALKVGRHKHPTKGTQRSESTKQKIGEGLLNAWDNISAAELDSRKQKARDNWNKLSDDEKANIIHKANLAVRKSSDEGSKLEKFLLSQLLSDGFRVDFHKEQFLVTTKLQIDLFLPTMNVAIEVDGPSHFEPIWGEDTLQKNVKYDNKKNGLITGKGLVLIRIKQNKDFSNARALLIYQKLKVELDKIKVKFPEPDNRYIELGDE